MTGFIVCLQQREAASPVSGNIMSQTAYANTINAIYERVETRISASQTISRNWCENDEKIAFLNKEELVMGKLLGSGTFANVHEVVAFKPNKDSSGISFSSSKDTERQVQARHSFSCSANNGAMARYAIKQLKNKSTIFQDDFRFSRAASDLVMEAAYLSMLDHENIIKIHGLPSAGIESYQFGRDGFFLVLDRLHETLSQRVTSWTLDQQRVNFLNRSLNVLRFGKQYFSQYREAQLLCRTKIARQVASALEYLHSRNIVFRDLKPDNVGFDPYGTVKLFDFGIAREIPECTTSSSGTFKMSGKAGSIRYMAPEVALCEKYNLKVDTYSWSLLYWTCLTLEKPFNDIVDRSKHLLMVCQKGQRPSIRGIPKDIRPLLEKSWTESINERLSMTEVCTELDSILKNLSSRTTAASKKAPARTKVSNKSRGQPGYGGLPFSKSMRTVSHSSSIDSPSPHPMTPLEHSTSSIIATA